jgi:hypothetical protein
MHALLATSPTARDLARVLGGWLALVLLLQALATAQGVVVGALHRHPRGGDPVVHRVVRPAFVHAGAAAEAPPAIPARPAVVHDHDDLQRHVHFAGDGAPAPVDAEDLGAAAAAWLAALPALLPAAHAPPADDASHVRVAGGLAPRAGTVPAPIERPPRD